jgi:hypothetical protein
MIAIIRKRITIQLESSSIFDVATAGELYLLGQQSSTGNMWQGYRKKLYFGQ